MAGVKFDGTSEIVELNIVGDWAWLRNRIRASATLPSGESRKMSGYTLSIVVKDSRGQWLLKRDANCLTPEK
jgi:ketosteroid isomerase-like protein